MKTITNVIYSALALFALVCLGPSPAAQAVVPPPDGGYPGQNPAEGQNALFSLTTGVWNTAVGWSSLSSNSAGSFNTAVGTGTLLFNVGEQSVLGTQNTAVGAAALLFNTTGLENTATGVAALLNNTEGSTNTATGGYALHNNTTGNSNTANGVAALRSNTIGFSNTAEGAGALFPNTTGSGNTALGSNALGSNTTGSSNIAVGSFAGHALTTGDHNIAIGNDAVSGESNTMRIGNGLQTRAFIAGIRGVATGNNDAVAVLIDSDGQLGTASSSRRFKKEIKPMDKASEAILTLKPVTFHYKSDNSNRSEFGLIAEEVAEVSPDLVVRDKRGEIYTVRYDAVNAMLLNEFLKEHRTVQQQQKEIDVLKAELKEQKALIQAVNDKVELSKPATQTVLNNQ